MFDFNFEPKTEEELTDLLEEGDGDFEVTAAEAQTSKNGNPMIKLSLKVWDKKGDQKFVYDYLILNGSKFSMRKIKHFCESCGMEEFYNSGKFSAKDCVGRSGKCVIGIEKGTVEYPNDKNVIRNYLAHSNSTNEGLTSKNNGAEAPDFDDNIPF
jgi:hypothetical protein